MVTSSNVCCKRLALGGCEYHRSHHPVPLKCKGSCKYDMIGVETGSRSFLKYRTVVRVHKSFCVSVSYINVSNLHAI